MDTAAGTAAPSELTIGGAAYRCRPLAFAEMGEFDRWARDSYLAEQARLVDTLDLTRTDRIEMLKAAVAMTGKLSMTTGDPEAMMIMAGLTHSLEGVTRLTWLSIKREHPNVTLQKIGEGMADPQMMNEALATFNLLNMGEDESGAEGKDGPVRRPKPRKKASR